MNQLDIPDNTVSDVSIKTVYSQDNSELYMEAKFAISSAKVRDAARVH